MFLSEHKDGAQEAGQGIYVERLGLQERGCSDEVTLLGALFGGAVNGWCLLKSDLSRRNEQT